jgi:regulator of sigma E protease
MTIIINLFWFVVTLSILVILHEGGHFLAARAFGVRVKEFMVGLPGPALKFHGKQTTYGVTAVPLGGYVRISGMEPGPEDERLATVLAYVTRRHNVTADEVAMDLGVSLEDAEMMLATLVDWDAVTRLSEDDERYESAHPSQLAEDPVALLDLARSTTYRALSAWKRVAILVAGVFVNLLSAVLVFVLVLTLVGIVQPTLEVSKLVPGGAAAAAGVKPGETITAFNGQSVKTWESLLEAIAARKPGETVKLSLANGSATRVVPVTLKADGNQPRLGIQAGAANVKLSVPEATMMSFGLVGKVFQAIGGFFVPSKFQQSVQNSTGVIGIAVMAGESAQGGPIQFAFFIALLSLSLGAMNILPIPPLDGGKVVLEIVEAIRHRPLSRRFSIGVSLTGFALLFTLISYLMYIDVLRYVVRGG